MLDVKKEKTEFGYKFTIITDSGEFYITFAGNLDLYFCVSRKQKDFNVQSFLITKENYRLYNFFDNLFCRVKNYQIFDTDLENKELMEKDLHNPNKLFKDNKIIWHSDDGEYDKVSKMIIEKFDENYKISFFASRDKTKFTSFGICICNSGSRYGYFNMIFMELYRELINYDFENHQIYIEEYLYNEKVKKIGRRQYEE